MTAIIKLDHSEYGLEEKKASEIQAVFQPMLARMVELENEYNEIIKLPMGFDTSTKAKEVRQKYVKVRTGTAKIHKEMKAFYLSGGRFVDALKNAQLFAAQGIEEKLEDIEKHFERKEQARKDELAATRFELLEPLDIETDHLNLGEMADDVWENYYKGVKSDYKKAAAANKLAAETEKASKEAEAKKVERINQVSGLGMVWIDALEHYEKAGFTITKHKILNFSDKDFTAAILETSKALDALKVIEDKAAAIEAKQAAETKATAEKLQAEKDTAKKLELDAEETKKNAELAPDKDKLNALASNIANLKLPNVSTKEAQKVIDETEALIQKVINYVLNQTKKL